MPKKREIKDLHKEDKIIEKFNIQTKKTKNKNSPILLNEMKINNELEQSLKEVEELKKDVNEEDIIKELDNEIEKSKIKEELLKKIDFEDEEFMILFIKKFIENYKSKYKDTSNIINSEMNHLIHVLNEYFYL